MIEMRIARIVRRRFGVPEANASGPPIAAPRPVTPKIITATHVKRAERHMPITIAIPVIE